MHAAGCNFMDILLVQGRYQRKPPFPFVPGVELAGVVREVGEGVTTHAPGDRVLAHVESGAYAERAVFSARRAFHMPEGMSFEEGAAIPITYPTSYAALVYRADLRPGETLLVHAAAGGVGLAAVQIGRALGARVIATAGGAEKCEIARRHGAELAIDYRDRDFVDSVMEATDGRGADVIYDSVGGDTTDRSLKCIAWNGRLLVVGFAGGQIPEIRANRIMLKNIAVAGVHWGGLREARAPPGAGLLPRTLPAPRPGPDRAPDLRALRARGSPGGAGGPRRSQDPRQGDHHDLGDPRRYAGRGLDTTPSARVLDPAPPGGPTVSDEEERSESPLQNLSELKVDIDNLYREETFTDLRVATLRRLVPVKVDGSPDASRTPLYSAQTTIMSQAGPLPVEAPIEAATLEEAAAKVPQAIQAAVDRLVEEARELRRREASRIVVPSGGMPPGGMPGGGGGGGIIGGSGSGIL